MKQITIDLLRHGDVANGKRLLGHSDEPLSALGQQQIHAILQQPTLPWTKVISSPLQRCSTSAKEFSNRHSLPLSIIDQFAEIDFGLWDGQLLTDLYDSPEAENLIQFMQDPMSTSPPEGETYQVFKSRVLSAWEELLKSLHQEQIEHCLLITHSGVIRTILSSVLGITDTNLFKLEIPYACLSRIKQYEDYPPILSFHNGQL